MKNIKASKLKEKEVNSNFLKSVFGGNQRGGGTDEPDPPPRPPKKEEDSIC
ncbi:hypothetical protein [Pseudoalteromonas phenolica]|uniref:hypothetical protein n=1 Tax=Pseudoalteromonas phenolica TaxID=161398 RepID=UPI0014873F79|nr:hypothetical protein [Pseudoalteromonas phenolica]